MCDDGSDNDSVANGDGCRGGIVIAMYGIVIAMYGIVIAMYGIVIWPDCVRKCI